MNVIEFRIAHWDLRTKIWEFIDDENYKESRNPYTMYFYINDLSEWLEIRKRLLKYVERKINIFWG